MSERFGAASPDKQKKSSEKIRTTLRAAIVAATAGLATPAYTQEAQRPPVEQVDAQHSLEELQNRIQKSVDAYKIKLGQLRRAFGEDLHLKYEEESLRRTEAVMQNPAYMRGMSLILDRQGSIDEFIAADTDAILDNDALIEQLNKIPRELDGKFFLTPLDIYQREEKLFDQQDFRALVEKFSTVTPKLSTDELKKIREGDQRAREFSDRLLRLDASGLSQLKVSAVLGLILLDYATIDDIVDSRFTEGLATLAQHGYKMSDLRVYSAVQKEKLAERIRDPKFANMIASVRRIGFGADELLDVPEEIYANPHFLKNAAALGKSNSVFASVYLTQSYMTQERFADVIGLLPRNSDILAVGLFRSLGNDPGVWESLYSLLQKYQDNPYMVKIVFMLDAQRLRNTEYMTFVEEYARATATRGDQNEIFARFSADSAFVRSKIGADPRSISIPDYRAATERFKDDPLVSGILSRYEGLVLRGPVLRMNELHDSAANVRLEQLRGLDAATVFDAMNFGGRDAYLSTFRLMYNGNGFTGDAARHSFIPKASQETGSLYQFLMTNNPDEKRFATFLELLSQNNLVDSFLNDLGSVAQQETILTNYLFDASKGISDTQALALSDLLHATKNVTVANFLLNGLQRGALTDREGKTQIISKLLIAEYFRSNRTPPEWAVPMIREYGRHFPDVKELSGSDAFRLENGLFTNNQIHFFYDDRAPGKAESTWDGHNSFRNFIQSLGGNVTWNAEGAITSVTGGRGADIKDEGEYVVIKKTNARAKRQIVIYANKPDRNSEKVAQTHSALIARVKPQAVIHRGHSYHVDKTIAQITEEVTDVSLGSCGGAKDISQVLMKAPAAHVTATRGVGTMLVNDTYNNAKDQMLLRDGKVDYARLRSELDRTFARGNPEVNERWKNYDMPHQNRTAHIISALRTLTQ